jgi:predicted Zn-dependent protease with MMP-like domain/Tfp pilus assembly protein PilF
MPRALSETDLDPAVVRLLDDGRDRFEEADYPAALAAAEEACRRAPRAVAAWHLRAASLAALSRPEEAEEAFERALDLDRDDPESLLAYAEFCVDTAEEEPERLEKALALLARGEKAARKAGDPEMEGEVAYLAGVALNQLGDPRAALERLDRALSLLGSAPEVRLEHAVARFELCEFEEAGRELTALLAEDPDDPWAHHYLGLVEERRGNGKAAEKHFARARKLAPEEFPAPVRLSEKEFDAAVEEALAQIPEKIRRYLENVAIAAEDFPPPEDLVESDPPLSPQILGIFRGNPWKDKASSDPWAHFPSSIVLYQRNLERFARDRDDLIEQIGVTLIHEVGHFLGLDEDDLRELGLD